MDGDRLCYFFMSRLAGFYPWAQRVGATTGLLEALPYTCFAK